MKVAVIGGAGYVGLTTGACLAELGNTVVCVDVDENKIQTLNKGRIPIFEPGLKEMVERNVRVGRLSFTTSTAEAVTKSEIIFISVCTPSHKDGSVNLEYVKSAAESIAKSMNSYKIIVNKSTVPVGTGDMVAQIIRKYYNKSFDVVSNPEFLREGSAIHDFMNPDRVIIGNGSEKAAETMQKLYAPLKCPVLITDLKSAELIKYASNAFLATQISFINELANLSEKVGADISKVAEGMKLDKRIGKHAFFNAGIGYGGSCFPKDVQGLIYTAKSYGSSLTILEKVHEVNKRQKTKVVEKLNNHINPQGKTIGILGLSFKPNTDDLREAPSLKIIEELKKHGARIKAYDPVAMDNAKKLINNVEFLNSPYEAARNSHALLIVTEWNEFRELNLEKLKSLMANPLVIDGRNIFSLKEMEEAGIKYEGIGK